VSREVSFIGNDLGGRGKVIDLLDIRCRPEWSGVGYIKCRICCLDSGWKSYQNRFLKYTVPKCVVW
jgi:hypothetical protein